MATKKTTTKKAAAKKPAAKKATTKKPAAKKPTAKNAWSSVGTPKASAMQSKGLQSLRRPDSNQPPSAQLVNAITADVLLLIGAIENYAANLRALDRQRHNGVGLRRQGFIDAAFRLSTKFPQYFPHWLTTAKFKDDLDLFTAVRSLVEVCRSLEEKAWNINVEASDMVYTDALEYYSQVQDAARRRVDSAESIYNELHSFFRRGPMEGGEPTQKKLKRDVDALLHGRKDGEVVIKNVKPKLTGGKHEVIDETFRDTAAFKETVGGEINE